MQKVKAGSEAGKMKRTHFLTPIFAQRCKQFLPKIAKKFKKEVELTSKKCKKVLKVAPNISRFSKSEK